MAPNETNITDSSTAATVFLKSTESMKSKMNDRNNNMNKVDDDDDDNQLGKEVGATIAVSNKKLHFESSTAKLVDNIFTRTSNNELGDTNTLVEPGQSSLIQRIKQTDKVNGTVSVSVTNGTKSHSKEDYYEATELVKTSNEQVYKPKLRWPDLGAQLFLHVGALYGLYYLISLQTNIRTFLWGMLLSS